MDIDIKAGVTTQSRPVRRSDAVTAALYMALAIVFAYPLIPVLAERNSVSGPTAAFLSGVFVVLAVLHLRDLVRIVRALHKSKADA